MKIKERIFGSLFLMYIVISQNLLNGRPIYDVEGNRRLKVMNPSTEEGQPMYIYPIYKKKELDMQDKSQEMQPGYIIDYNLMEEYRNFNPEGYEQYKKLNGTLTVPFDEYQRFLKSDEYQNFLRSEEELSSWEWYWNE